MLFFYSLEPAQVAHKHFHFIAKHETQKHAFPQ